MGDIVGRFLRKGSRRVYSTSFETAKGAKRAARAKAREAGTNYEAGTPFRHGAGYNVYIHKKK